MCCDTLKDTQMKLSELFYPLRLIHYLQEFIYYQPSWMAKAYIRGEGKQRDEKHNGLRVNEGGRAGSNIDDSTPFFPWSSYLAYSFIRLCFRSS